MKEDESVLSCFHCSLANIFHVNGGEIGREEEEEDQNRSIVRYKARWDRGNTLRRVCL